ncbi:IS66 family transposase [Ruminococcus albus]|nr:IS66 family transposase [Ruminococcus albus]MCC3350782.1 IS66 family transposase [Ruminococcus albus 8]
MSEQNMTSEIVSLRNENAVLREELALANQQLEWFRKQIFGRKTEQTSVVMEKEFGVQLSMFGNIEEKSIPKETVTISEHKRKKKRTHDDWMSSLKIKEEHHEIEAPVCEICGAEMKDIGTEKAYDELVYTPAKFHIRRHIVHKYKCPECGEKPEERDENCHIVRATYPHAMILGSYCSPELLAHIIYEKYAKSVPLHRQEKDFNSKKIPLLKATMSNWVGHAAEKWCLPIVEKMHKMLIAGNIIHADETTVQVLHEEGRKPTTTSRMWVYCNGKMNDRSIIIFDYRPTRKGEHAKNFLAGFTGYLICDGYDAYNAVEGAKRCGCWTHNRRHFVECLPKDKSAYSTSVAAKAVAFCNRIYHEESLLADSSAEYRYEQRLAKVKPLLDEFFAWLETVQVSGKGKLTDAVRYALNERKYLYTFLENGDIPIDNNRAENAIRPFAVGRKNWLFSNTANGAKASAALYSIISTAQANGLDAEKYLTELFSQTAGTILLPWREEK